MNSSLYDSLATVAPHTAEKFAGGQITGEDALRFLRCHARKQREIDGHEVIVNNRYTKWFKLGLATPAQLIDLIEQFSVFSNWFRVILCLRMVLARTDAEEESCRNILANEFGVGINIATGNAEGKRFAHKNCHLEWLRDLGAMVGLERRALGRDELATQETETFIRLLMGLYSNPDTEGQGASFGIETWAGFGIGTEEKHNNFWQELITGLEGFNERSRLPQGLMPLPDKFFLHHRNLETAHVVSVERELEKTFFDPSFDEEKWFAGARQALDAIQLFWEGLDKTRKRLEAEASDA